MWTVFIDEFKLEFNILKVAGSSLGYKHTEESLVKFSGENYHLFGKTHSSSMIEKLSGQNNHMFMRRAKLHPMYKKSPSAITRELNRISQGT